MPPIDVLLASLQVRGKPDRTDDPAAAWKSGWPRKARRAGGRWPQRAPAAEGRPRPVRRSSGFGRSPSSGPCTGRSCRRSRRGARRNPSGRRPSRAGICARRTGPPSNGGTARSNRRTQPLRGPVPRGPSSGQGRSCSRRAAHGHPSGPFWFPGRLFRGRRGNPDEGPRARRRSGCKKPSSGPRS